MVQSVFVSDTIRTVDPGIANHYCAFGQLELGYFGLHLLICQNEFFDLDNLVAISIGVDERS